jgi:chitodextrinase
MFTAIRSTAKTGNKVLSLLALGILGAASMGLSGCAGLVSSAGSGKGPGNSTLTISNAAATSATFTGVQVQWTTSAPANSQVNYGKTSAYGSTTGVLATMETTHQIAVASLLPGTSYHFQILSTDASGNSATSGDMTFSTLADSTPPTVSIISPAAGATLAGIVNLTANAADSIVSVASVQFKVDGVSNGAALTAAPYTTALNTASLSNGNHTLTAVATDTVGNSATSAAVAVKVNNTSTAPPPTIAVTAPASGATVSATVTVAASASSSAGIASVQFQLDGANVGAAGAASPYTFSWDTTKSSNGNHTLAAVATDKNGLSATSTGVTVTVNNTTNNPPPTVSMTAPTNGATVSNTVTVSANASSSVGIGRVQFQLDNANVGAADTVAPYNYSWDTTKSGNGTHTLRAIATDTSNNSTTSASVTVTVSNATNTTPPTVPTGLTATAVSSSQINLSWTASTDNVGVTGYKVFRAGAQIGTSTTTTYSDGGLTASTTYSYTVSAYDAAGNNSAQSSSASATTQAGSSGGGLPTSIGWYQIPNTTYAPLCPTGQAGSCSDVIGAWNSGAADTKRNRLLFMGGGHNNYSGNEVYALDLNTLQMLRLNNPDPVNGSGSDVDPSGNPNSRHTYGGLSYIPSTDQMYLHGGAVYPTGYGQVSTWLLNLSNLTWAHKDPVNGTAVTSNCCNYQTFGDYDPVTDSVWYTDVYDLWKYKAQANTQTHLSAVSNEGFHINCVVDYDARFFTCFGDGYIERADMTAATPSLIDITSQTSGCSSLTAAQYPGLAYDPSQKKIIAWLTGASVIVFDSTTRTCAAQTFGGTPPGAPTSPGTFNRWRYFPALGVFALVNDWQQNAWVLRMTAASGGSGPVISGTTVNSITTTSAAISWTTDVPSTTQVEYGVTNAYGSLTTLNATLVTNHSQSLTGLTAGTVYHYRVHSANSSGVQTVSSDAVFSTSSTSTTPPTITITTPVGGATVSGTVTVAANASDNVGVTSVQFKLDGANLGSALTSRPYQISWSTTTAGNGTHTLTATALDAAGNVGNATAVTVTVSNSGTTSAMQDFQNRCASPGVIVCQGFDDPAGIPSSNGPGSGAVAANNGTSMPTQDTSITASGAGSLRFDIPTPAGTSNPDGYWRQLTQSSLTAGPSTAQLFGQNSTFYVQFRQRMSPAYVSNTWGGGTFFKQSIFATDSSTCGSQELTTVNGDSKGFPQMYSSCGADSFIIDLGTGDFLLEQGDSSTAGFNCHYQSPTNCFFYQPNVWMTFTYEVHIGTWGLPNSSIQAWATVNGQPLAGHQFINIQNHVLNQDGGSVAKGYNAIYLLSYFTGGYTGASGPATTWYDELIVSSQPIAAPNN